MIVLDFKVKAIGVIFYFNKRVRQCVTVLEEMRNESDNSVLPPPHLLHPSTLSEYKQVFITSRRKSGKERSNVKM